MGIALIWAQNPAGVIGADGTQPWDIPEDLARFRRLTAGHPVVMGRRTWQALPAGLAPLPGRRNLVLTGSGQQADSIRAAGGEPISDLAPIEQLALDGEVWVIGGGQVYAALVDQATRLEVTIVDQAAEGDTYAPAIGGHWRLTERDPATGWQTSRTGTRYRFETYRSASEATA